jgi:serine/threonine protein kinase
MSFEPRPGQKLHLNGESIEFTALDASGPAAVFLYAEAGKEGVIYRVLKGGKYYALKVFYPDYQDRRLLKNTEKISQLKHLEGFRVADRVVVHETAYPNLVKEYPELNYSVLMPWIQGTIWGNLMNEDPLSSNRYTQIATALMKAVNSLEAQGLAHCDLSNNNFIIDPSFSSVELIDIEDMYSPGMPRPVPDVSFGTPGYRTKWIAEHGLWGPNSDRFASAILCSEILTWHNQEIRDSRAGDTAFFDEGEIGEESERYRIMKACLGRVNNELPSLFEKAWFSANTDDCPSAISWLEKVNGNSEYVIENETGLLNNREEFKTSSKNVNQKTHNIDNIQNVKSGLPDQKSFSRSVFGLLVLFLSSGLFLALTISILGIFVQLTGLSSGSANISINYFIAILEAIATIAYTVLLAFVVGVIQLTIYRGRIKSKKISYLFSLLIGGGAGGLINYLFLYFLGWFDAVLVTSIPERIGASFTWFTIGLVVGVIVGGIVGTVSAFLQNLMMTSYRNGFRWFFYSLISWSVIYGSGLALALGIRSLINFPFIGDTIASFFILLSHGLSLIVFLYFSPEIEFS